jgi:hypothetical protein
MGETQYNYLLSRVLLLPFDAHDVAHLGEVELTRYRALEAMHFWPPTIFVEGWALYGEEMMRREGLYSDGSAAEGQVCD